MTAEARAHVRFRRAIEHRALWMAEDAARELPNLPLEEALQLVHLYAERGSPKFEKAAMRWLERHLTEGSPRLRHLGELRRGPLQGSRSAANQSILRPVPIYHLHDTAGDDLGLLEHPATNVEPGDVVHLADGREALVTTRAETNDEAIWALLEVLVAPSSPHIPTWRGVDFPGSS